MVKFNFILPDLRKTANNELEAFVIPGDFESAGVVTQASDARSPWIVALPLAAGTASTRTASRSAVRPSSIPGRKECSLSARAPATLPFPSRRAGATGERAQIGDTGTVTLPVPDGVALRRPLEIPA
jgi:hypothetical protein